MGKKQIARPVIGYSPFDRAIIEGFSANKSAEEIARSAPINGTLTPAQCLNRLTQLVESKDVLDVYQKKMLILDNTYQLSARLKKQMDDMEFIDKDNGAMFLRTQKELMDMVERVKGEADAELMAFNQRRADEFTAALAYIFDALLERLAQKYPEIEVAEAQELVLEVIPASLPEVK
jgi:hypothetical protein